PLADAPLESVTVKLTVYVPLTALVMLCDPVPVYGEVPPVALTVQLNGLPAVRPDVGQETVTTSGCAVIVTDAEPVAVAPFASVTLKLWVNVPLTGRVTLKVPVPVYGDVPPEADTVQLNGLVAVSPDVGQVTMTTRGCGATLTVAEPLALAPLASVTVNLSL